MVCVLGNRDRSFLNVCAIKGGGVTRLTRLFDQHNKVTTDLATSAAIYAVLC